MPSAARSATGEAKDVEQYTPLWRYIWKHWVDHTPGGGLGVKMSRDNRRFNDEKDIAGGKCDYHSMIACIEALRAFP